MLANQLNYPYSRQNNGGTLTPNDDIIHLQSLVVCKKQNHILNMLCKYTNLLLIQYLAQDYQPSSAIICELKSVAKLIT